MIITNSLWKVCSTVIVKKKIKKKGVKSKNKDKAMMHN